MRGERPATRTELTAQLRCAECRTRSDALAQGWRAYRYDEPHTDEPPALAFYCPDCPEREFGD